MYERTIKHDIEKINNKELYEHGYDKYDSNEKYKIMYRVNNEDKERINKKILGEVRIIEPRYRNYFIKVSITIQQCSITLQMGNITVQWGLIMKDAITLHFATVQY